MKSSLRKLRGFALQRHEQRVDRDRGGRGHSAAAATMADELLAAAQVCGPCLSLSLRGRASEPGGRVSRLRLWRSRASWGSSGSASGFRSSRCGLLDSARLVLMAGS